MSVEEKPLEKPEIKLISRHFFPNAVTMLAMCSGMTGVFYAGSGNIMAAVSSLFLAAILDALDGRVARATGAASSFGAELDSLADVVCFGALPGFILYQWGLNAFGTLGWMVSLAIPVAAALRLARFNTMAAAPKPVWMANYFTGVPAPAGGFLSLGMLYADYAGLIGHEQAAVLALANVILVALLMVSRLPTFSGKSMGRRALKIWLFPSIAALLAALVGAYTYPWTTLTIGVLAYLLTLPLAKWRHAIVSGRYQPPA